MVLIVMIRMIILYVPASINGNVSSTFSLIILTINFSSLISKQKDVITDPKASMHDVDNISLWLHSIKRT